MCVSLAEPRVVVESTSPVTLDTVEDYAAESGDCIVQVPEVRTGTAYGFSNASIKALVPLETDPTVGGYHRVFLVEPMHCRCVFRLACVP